MRDVDAILDGVYVGDERVGRAEIYRRVVAAGAPADVVTALDALPEGTYAQDEVAEAIAQITGAEQLAEPGTGIPGSRLGDDDLLREMGELHRTRNDAVRHGSDQALAHHNERLAELEGEYRRRYPDREVDPDRLRSGARERVARIRPVEESPQVARAVEDETPVAALADDRPAVPDPATDVLFQEATTGREAPGREPPA